MARDLWEENLSVGVDVIDEQHKMLLSRLSELSESVSQRRGSGQIVGTLSFLSDYVDFHFGTEERHMTANDYPGYEEHKAAHEEFKRTLKRLSDDFEEEGATTGLADSINTLLINWFLKHIRQVDQQLGRFFREKGVDVTAESE
ncbi:MAG: bacteriohemerythrin [Candidatus Eisenbacteria bacterium]|nr:bacteriohemerythrin [Candidatus Eisenbacteria bacterium]